VEVTVGDLEEASWGIATGFELLPAPNEFLEAPNIVSLPRFVSEFIAGPGLSKILT
jgi:hypothetical protein